jgi:hypothetical protein
VLGVAGGTAVGYGVQARRPPVPLGTLAQPGLVYPAKAGRPAAPLPASQDAGARTAGDLRKALVAVPAGAHRKTVPGSADGWLPVAAYADTYARPGSVLSGLLAKGFRRAVGVSWREGDRTALVTLVQFVPAPSAYARDWTKERRAADGDAASVRGIPGSPDGFVADATGGNGALAFASRGDTVLDIRETGGNGDDGNVLALTERQLGRL